MSDRNPPDSVVAYEQPALSWFQRLLGRSDIVFGGSVYMRRWRLIQTRWGGLRVHQICRSDSDRECHDHPFDFTSLILSSGYIEHLPYGVRREFKPWQIVRHKAEDLHRLELHENKDRGAWTPVHRPAWTLVFQGPRRRRWGFQTEEGWVDAMDFDRHKESLANRNEVPK